MIRKEINLCRSQSDPLGAYRCVPSRGFLAMSSSSEIIHPYEENYIRGAFWHDKDNIPTIDDILYVKNSLKDKVYFYLNRDIEDPKTKKYHNQHDRLVHEYAHLGNMVASLADSRVPNLDKRLLEIQTLVVEYHVLERNGSIDEKKLDEIELKVTEQSLALGWELQNHTRDILEELGTTDQKINPVKIKGHETYKELIVENSQYFPSQWNSQVKAVKKVIKAKKDDSSSYTSSYKRKFIKHNGKFEIAKGKDGIFYYASIEEARQSEINNPEDFYGRHEAVHEMTHMFEKGSRLLRATTASFLKRRVTNEKGESLPIPSRTTPDKKVYTDNFPNIFTGTIYGGDLKSNEVMARGTESVLLGSNGSLIGLPTTGSMYQGENTSIVDIIPDIEHRNLTLGLLVGIELEKDL